jgi:hypothetical protein
MSAVGTAGACKHKHSHRRNRQQNKARKPNLQAHTAIRGDSWGVSDSFMGEKEYAITGEVTWNGPFRGQVYVMATFYDRRGRVLSSDGIDSLQLASGTTGGFQIDYLSDNPKRVAEYRLSTEVFRA